MITKENLKQFTINDFLPEKLRHEAYKGTVICSDEAKRVVRLQILGSLGEYRNHKIRITPKKIHGNVLIWLSHGQSDIEINTAGPINLDLRVWRDLTVKIGRGTTINQARIIADDADISIGDDNLWSDDIIVQSSDQHGIYDLTTEKLVRTSRRYFVTENHVWIGRRATLMPNIEIGTGSIIGAGSVVTKSIGKFSAAAGNPARIVKENTTWSRSFKGFSKEEEINVLRNYRSSQKDAE